MYRYHKNFGLNWYKALNSVWFSGSLFLTGNTISLFTVAESKSVVLAFESVDEILWCDNSNQTVSAAFYMIPFGF